MSDRALVTLTTDFGTRDGYVGAMKGRLLTLAPQVRIIDISHDIDAQDVEGAAWCLARACPQFPSGSIHVAVIDPGVGSERPALLAERDGQWFIGPDNGVFARAWRHRPPDAVWHLHRETRWWSAHRSFDGLAVFAPAAACVANGIEAAEMGIRSIHYEPAPEPAPVLEENGLAGEILTFDRFGNAITNLGPEQVAMFAGSAFRVECRAQSWAFVTHYAAQGGTARVALINSDGLLELAVAGDSARERFALERGDRVFLCAEPGGT